jgi:chromate reductase, NAD(P)H dehydrogenase (quinone)
LWWVRDAPEPPLAAYRQRVFALGAASNGTHGGYRSLIALRHVLELGCGAMVLPDQIAVRDAASAFDDMDNLRDEANANRLRAVLGLLVDAAHQLA